MPINTGQPRGGHAGIEDFLGGDVPSPGSSEGEASNDHIEYQYQDHDAKPKAAEVKRLKRLREIRKAEEKERFRLKEEKRIDAERKTAEAKLLEKEKRNREAAELERLQKVKQERLRNKLEEQKRLEEQPLVGINGEQESVNDIQNSHSQPVLINRGPPFEGHAGIGNFLGGDVSSPGSSPGSSPESSPGSSPGSSPRSSVGGASNDHIAHQYQDHDINQWVDPSGFHHTDQFGNPVNNVPETADVDQRDTRQNDVYMHDHREDQLDYPSPQDSQLGSMQPDDQTGHGDPDY